MMEIILRLSMKILKCSLSLKEMIGEMDEDGSGTVDFEVSQGYVYIGGTYWKTSEKATRPDSLFVVL